MNLDLRELTLAIGYLGLSVIFFSQSGLIIGFFLPGDSLLITAGILAQEGYLNIFWLIPLLVAASFLGDFTGYTFGKKVGTPILTKKSSFFYNKEYLKKAHNFYKRFGSLAVVLGRFIPMVRTFVPIIAGVVNMSQKVFLVMSLIGASIWITTLTLFGYFLGAKIPNLDNYLIIIIIVTVLLPVILKIFEHFRVNK